MKYLVMMPNSWGRGDTLTEAEKNARKAGSHGKRKVQRIAWQYDPQKTPNAYINDYGNLCWEGDKPQRIAL